MTECQTALLNDWMSDCLIEWLNVRLPYWMTECQTALLKYWISDCLIKWLNVRLPYWMTECQTAWVYRGLTERRTACWLQMLLYRRDAMVLRYGPVGDGRGFINYVALHCCCDGSDDQLDIEDRMHPQRMRGFYSFPSWLSVGPPPSWVDGWPQGNGLWPFAKTVYLTINWWLKVMSRVREVGAVITVETGLCCGIQRVGKIYECWDLYEIFMVFLIFSVFCISLVFWNLLGFLKSPWFS